MSGKKPQPPPPSYAQLDMGGKPLKQPQAAPTYATGAAAASPPPMYAAPPGGVPPQAGGVGAQQPYGAAQPNAQPQQPYAQPQQPYAQPQQPYAQPQAYAHAQQPPPPQYAQPPPQTYAQPQQPYAQPQHQHQHQHQPYAQPPQHYAQHQQPYYSQHQQHQQHQRHGAAPPPPGYGQHGAPQPLQNGAGRPAYSPEDDGLERKEHRGFVNRFKMFVRGDFEGRYTKVWSNDPPPEAAPDATCDYTRRGHVFHRMRVYSCKTCRMPKGVGVCEVCAFKCHAAKGHKLKNRVVSEAYCDCGASPDSFGCCAVVRKRPQ